MEGILSREGVATNITISFYKILIVLIFELKRMKTKLFSTCTGLFLFALFHGSLAFRTINQRKNGRLLRNGIIFKGSNKSSMRMHLGHDHNHDHEEDQHEDQQSYRILDKIPLSRWGEFLRPITFLSRTQGSVVVRQVGNLVLIPHTNHYCFP